MIGKARLGGSDDSESKLGDLSKGLGLLTNIEDPRFGCCCVDVTGGGSGILIPLDSMFDPV